ncbi:MAG: carboxylesterase family protein [Aquabacterium sp.]
MAVTLALLAAAATATSARASSPTATISEGQLAGIADGDGVARFLGVPYAQPPLGDKRWRSPQAPTPWAGVRSATQFGASCPQSATLFGAASVNEDCLTLNVYAPQAASTSPRPVLVYIHGGGFRDGSGANYDASVLARKTDAVVVTLNYRLGVFGFLTTTGLTTEDKAVNFGLQDQYFALGWVQRNIAAFGGDPGRVTIAGQSAGGGSGCLALTSPKAAGLFHRVIMHSAPCAMATTPLKKALARGKNIADKVGCAEGPDQIACLRAKSVPELMAAAQIATPTEAISDSFWPATIDGEVVTSATLSALANGKFHKVPVMMGTTRDEGKGLVGWGFHGALGREVTQAEYEGAMKNFAGDLGGQIVTSLYTASKYGSVSRALAAAMTDVALACPTHNAASSLAQHVPTYAFEFADTHAPQFFQDPFMPEGWGAYHGGDLLYVFQTPVSGLTFPGLNTAQLALSDQMLGYWRNFMATGNPNSGDAGSPPRWPRFNQVGAPVQSLQPGGITTLTGGEYTNSHKCLLWSSYYGLGAMFGMY